METLHLQVGDWILANYWHRPGIIKRILLIEQEHLYYLTYVNLDNFLLDGKKFTENLSHNSYLNGYLPEASCWRCKTMPADFIIKVPTPQVIFEATDHRGQYTLF
ncbi:hypothetical protein [Telluribacter humicola]|uniref:hypothetical protein n=1 Tax=Telluribacter humicola TaxID=1720261 RepID=UPI001A963974|nr:hypothetical protein [Telluribacter humicola]